MPEPPRDLSALTDLPVASLDSGWRVFRARHGPVYFFRGPSRFVPAALENTGVLYLADSLQTALVEAFGGRSFVSERDVRESAVARIPLSHLKLADATAAAAKSLGLTPQIALAADEGPSQRWAAALI